MVEKTGDEFGASIELSNFSGEDPTTSVRVGETLTLSFKAILGDLNLKSGTNSDISVKVFLYRNGEPEALTEDTVQTDGGKVTNRDKTVLIDDSTSFQGTETDIATGDLTTNSYQSNDDVQDFFSFGFETEEFFGGERVNNGGVIREETAYLRMVSEYESIAETRTATTTDLTVEVKPRTDTQERLSETGQDITEGPGGEVIGGAGGQSVVQSAFDDQPSFALKALEFEDGFNAKFEETGADGNPQLKLNERYNRPRVAIDTAARFVEHEIIGAKKVRQRVGSDPIELSINGVCQRPRANEIDQLHRVETATLQSERLPQQKSKIPVHIASTTTEPLEDGGAADAKTGELLYTFTINAVEVIEK